MDGVLKKIMKQKLVLDHLDDGSPEKEKNKPNLITSLILLVF